MKKRVLSLILIAALALAAAPSLAEDPDPIIGSWYMVMNVDNLSSPIPNFAEYTRLIQVLSFEEDGLITNFEVDWKTDYTYTINGPSVVGSWAPDTKTHYSAELFGVGSTTIYLTNGMLYITFDNNTYFGFRKCEDFSFTADMTNKNIITMRGW